MKWRVASILSVTLLAALVTGCNLVSDPAKLTETQTARSVATGGLQSVLSALSKMSTVKTYQLKAQMQVSTGRFVRTANFYGTIVLPSTIDMDETIGGANYVLYQNSQFSYFRNGNVWEAMAPLGDLRPWDSLLTLLKKAPPHVVYALPRQTVVAYNCNVYQFETLAAQGNLAIPSSLYGGNSKTLAERAMYTVWIDANDGQLRQIEVQSTVGVPELGTSSFAGTTFFSDYNQKMSVKVPADLLAQVERP